MSNEIRLQIPSNNGEPAWEAAYFLPLQGQWSEEDFLRFHTKRMAELVNGRLEILPMPTLTHQKILRWLLALVEAAAPPGGLVLFAPLPCKLFPGTIREPDLLYISPEHLPGPEIEYPSQLDLAIEIVSSGAEARQRDYQDKRVDYAKAGVAEYWIVDPEQAQVTILTLEGQEYREYSVSKSGATAASLLLADLSVNVQDMLAAGRIAKNS